MSAPDSEPPSMEEDVAVLKEEEGSPDVPLSAPPASIPSSSPPFPNTATPNFTVEAMAEGGAASMTSTEAAASSPAEASPAKPAEANASDVAAQTSPPTSRIASASDSLAFTETSLFDKSEPPPSPSLSPSSEFRRPDLAIDFPRVLTFKGVSVTLENDSVWKKFYNYDTEMILTKPGRRMFPYCRYRLSGLNPKQKYSLVLSIVPWDHNRYRWNKSHWEVSGAAEHQIHGLIRMFPHHQSPCLGSDWTSNLVSFYKLKLTNNFQDSDGHIILNSMHRYIPRLHVIPLLEGDGPTADNPVVMGPESMTFTFPQTRFMGVTSYQNVRITQLKIYFNPFARGFKEDGSNALRQKIANEPEAAMETDATQVPSDPDEAATSDQVVMDLSLKSCTDSALNLQETRLVPIMSNAAGKADPFTPCIRGRFSLGQLVLVKTTPEREDGDAPVGAAPESDSEAVASPCENPVRHSPETSPSYGKRRKKMNRRWPNVQAREHKAAPAAVRSPSLTASMQPETDDVEGLLFVSFTSKEALDVHLRVKPAAETPQEAPASSSTVTEQSMDTVEAKPETDDVKITHLESVLLYDLRVLKHRQVIHPVLQEVGLKLSSLDPTKPIDLQYLGVTLPVPPPNRSEETLLSTHAGLPFISRTGKTSDVTKIKGWKTKFMTSNEASSSNAEGLQKNLSAFCSNMLDEYLESEAQRITERAAAFSTNPEGSVTYQLPAKSSSYVKTLDSALKHRNAASKSPVKTDTPRPLYQTPLDGPTGAGEAAAPSKSGSDSTSDHVSQRTSAAPGQKPAAFQSCRPTPFRLTKARLQLLNIEMAAMNEGLSRMHLTPDRLSVALSVLVTRQSESSRVTKVYPKEPSEGPSCAEVHCRLGCVCPDQEALDRNPVHCRKPGCMFHCSCSERSAARRAAEGGGEQQIGPVPPGTNTEHVVRPHPGSHSNTLWNRNVQDEDPEPLFTPKSFSNTAKCSRTPSQAQAMQEDDEDPSCNYSESMTCARVREIGPRPPRQVRTQPHVHAVPEPNASGAAKPKRTPDVKTAKHVKKDHGAGPAPVKQEEKTPERIPSSRKGTKTQIQIQSLCPWQKDRRMVLKALCSRMSQNQLSERFHIGCYVINPIDKICVRKPSGTVVSYRIQIGVRPSESEDDEEEEEEEEEFAGSEEEEEEKPEMFFGVTPFLRGVMPAGRMRVKKKSPGGQEQGLVQVNDKFYNHAKLMVGTIGSLHPANRLAAFVTGRLRIPSVFTSSRKWGSTHRPSALENHLIKASGPPGVTANLKTETQPQGQLIQPDLCSTGSPASNQDPLSAPSQPPPAGSLQNNLVSSGFSITVSPSLKSPSFLDQSGTCSFRIYPPSSGGADPQKLPGISLPGGFTLIQLPKPSADDAPSACLNGADRDDGTQPSNRFNQLASSWLGVKIEDKIRNLLSGKSENGFGDEVDGLEESRLSRSPEEFSSYSSDYSDDSDDHHDEHGDAVDVETVEEGGQATAIAEMWDDAVKNFQHSSRLDEIEDNKPFGNSKRHNHIAIERTRRHQQRLLFSRLSTVLRRDPKSSRLAILKQAFQEIQDLNKFSELLTQEQKMLAARQHAYLRRLSLLSGKSAVQIKHKLTEICARQKMEEASNIRVFSNLLKSRAAHLEAAASQSDPESENGGGASSQADLHMIPAHHNIRRMLCMLQPHLHKTPSDSSGEVGVAPPASSAGSPSPLGSMEPGEVVDLFQANQHPSKPDVSQEPSGETPARKNAGRVPKLFRVPRGEASPQSSRSSAKRQIQPREVLSKPLTLPLIRSKTGRIILPSCLKPLGNGLYTLMVIKAKDKQEVSAPADGDKSENDAHPPEDGQTSSASEDKSTPSDLNPKASGAPSELILYHSPSGPPEDPAAARKSKALLSNTDVSRILAATRLTIYQLPQNRKMAVKHSRGRPPTRVKQPGQAKRPGRPRAKTLEDKPETTQKDAVSDEVASPAAAKRRRPQKRSSEEPAEPPAAKRAPRRLSKSKDVDPESSHHQFRNRRSGGEPSASRPMTRGALGKDFPSAKKRSWIDMEKELDSEIDAE